LPCNHENAPNFILLMFFRQVRSQHQPVFCLRVPAFFYTKPDVALKYQRSL
jgi:hypothetical protein